MKALVVHSAIEAPADEPPEWQREEGKDEGLPGLERQRLGMPALGSRFDRWKRDQRLDDYAGKVDGHHQVSFRRGLHPDSPGDDLAARESHLELTGMDMNRIGAIRRLVEMGGGHGDGHEDEHDQQGEVDDRQDVGEGDAVSAHGWKVTPCGVRDSAVFSRP